MEQLVEKRFDCEFTVRRLGDGTLVVTKAWGFWVRLPFDLFFSALR